MIARIHLQGNKNADDFMRYNRPENEVVVGKDEFRVWDKNGAELVAGDRRALVAWLRQQAGGKRYAMEGKEGVLAFNPTVTYALKHQGLIDLPQQAREYLDVVARAGLKAFGEKAIARTTSNGAKTELPVEPRYIVAYAVNNRAGECELSVNIFALKPALDAVGHVRAMDVDQLRHRQKLAQAAAGQALGHVLKDKGIFLLPDRGQVTAIGYSAKTRASERIDEAVGDAGPKKRAAAARQLANETPKRVLSWREALANLTGTFNAALSQAVSGAIVSLDTGLQRRMAEAAAVRAFGYQAAAGFPRMHENSVRATFHQLCTPDVRPDIAEAAWVRVTAAPDRFGMKEVRQQPDGARVWAPTAQVGLEQGAAASFIKLRKTNSAGLDNERVAASLVGLNLPQPLYGAVKEMCSDGGLRWASAYQPEALQLVASAYHRQGRQVHLVGDPAAGATFSPTGFLDATQRTGHLRSIWLGLRSECWLTGDPLRKAEQIRAAKPKVRVKEGDLIVLTPRGLEDAAAVDRIAQMAAKAGAKVVMAGAGAEVFRDLVREQTAGRVQ